MIRTHEPRGHIWTNASVFQRTTEFRNIRYDECKVISPKIYGSDPEARQTETELAAKRQRIEKLADNFLNGEPLYIASARPCSETLLLTISWHQKRLGESTLALPSLDASEKATDLWDDAEDELEILRRHRSRQKQRTRTKVLEQDCLMTQGSEDETVIDIQAQASCKPATRLKVLKITAGPSEEALRQAAALRARRMQRANSEVPAVVRPLRGTHATRAREPRSEPNFDVVDDGCDLRPRQWLSRRKSRTLIVVPLGDDDSGDELRLSRVETPQTLSKDLRLSEKSTNTLRQAPEDQNDASLLSATLDGEVPRNTATTDLSYETICEPGPLDPSTAAIVARTVISHSLVLQAENEVPDETQSDKRAISGSTEDRRSYHTAFEESELMSTIEPPLDRIQSQDDSQARLLRSQGFRRSSCKSFTSVNEDTSILDREPSPREVITTSCGDSSEPAIRKSLQQSAGDLTGKPGRSGRARLSPGQHQRAGDGTVLPQVTYTKDQTDPNGSTPFKWRKRGPAPITGEAKEQTAPARQRRDRRRRVTFPSSDQGGRGSKHALAVENEEAFSNPPVLDMSFEHDSSFAPKLNMALVDEHMNSILPTDPGSGRRSSAVKRAIRREMRDSGAQFLRRTIEPPTSSQLDAEPVTAQNSLAESPQANDHVDTLKQSECWPGTQVMLNQAQKELVTSPEKRYTHSKIVSVATPSSVHSVAEGGSSSGRREPLKQLSQEPMPSTQAILGNFEGFSTVKKPRRFHQESPFITPTATGKGKGRLENLIDTSNVPSPTPKASLPVNNKARRSSSLRFSMSSIKSSPPVRPKGRSSPVDRRTGSLTSGKGNHTETAVGGSPGHHHEDDELYSQSVSSVAPLPSFQAAQAQSSLSCEDPALDGTIDELTTAVLWTKDMEGVLSQV